MLTVKKVLTLKVQISYVNVNMTKNIHEKIVYKGAPRKESSVINSLAPEVNQSD